MRPLPVGGKAGWVRALQDDLKAGAKHRASVVSDGTGFRGACACGIRTKQLPDRDEAQRRIDQHRAGFVQRAAPAPEELAPKERRR